MASERLVDDSTILDEAELWRRIHPEWVVPDENTGGFRLSSAAFDDSPDGSPTSVLLVDIVRETGRDEEDVLAGFDGYTLASVTAGDARGCKQGIARDPLPNEPAHAYVFGSKTKSLKRCLARHAQWIIPPHT